MKKKKKSSFDVDTAMQAEGIGTDIDALMKSEGIGADVDRAAPVDEPTWLKPHAEDEYGRLGREFRETANQIRVAREGLPQSGMAALEDFADAATFGLAPKIAGAAERGAEYLFPSLKKDTSYEERRKARRAAFGENTAATIGGYLTPAGAGNLAARAGAIGVRRLIGSAAKPAIRGLAESAAGGAFASGTEAALRDEEPAETARTAAAGAGFGAAGHAAAAGARTLFRATSPWIRRAAQARETGQIPGALEEAEDVLRAKAGQPRQLPRRGQKGVDEAAQETARRLTQEHLVDEARALSEHAPVKAREGPRYVYKRDVAEAFERAATSPKIINPQTGAPYKGRESALKAIRDTEAAIGPESPTIGMLADQREALRETANFPNKAPSNAERGARAAYGVLKDLIRGASPELGAADVKLAQQKRAGERFRRVMFGSKKPLSIESVPDVPGPRLDPAQEEAIETRVSRLGDTTDAARRRAAKIDEAIGFSGPKRRAVEEFLAQKARAATQFGLEPIAAGRAGETFGPLGPLPYQVGKQNVRAAVDLLEQLAAAGTRGAKLGRAAGSAKAAINRERRKRKDEEARP